MRSYENATKRLLETLKKYPETKTDKSPPTLGGVYAQEKIHMHNTYNGSDNVQTMFCVASEHYYDYSFHTDEGDWDVADILCLDWQADFEGKYTHVTRILERKYKDLIYVITTSHGYSIRVAKDQRFMTTRGGNSKTAEELRVGDYICINRDGVPDHDVVIHIKTFENDYDCVYELTTESHWFEIGAFVLHNFDVDEWPLFYAGTTQVLVRHEGQVLLASLKNLWELTDENTEYEVFSNGRWKPGYTVWFDTEPMLRIRLSNGKEIIATQTTGIPCLVGNKPAQDVTETDYVMLNATAFEPAAQEPHDAWSRGYGKGASLSVYRDYPEDNAIKVVPCIGYGSEQRSGVVSGWLHATEGLTKSKDEIDVMDAICTSLGLLTTRKIVQEDGEYYYKLSLVEADENYNIRGADCIFRDNSFWARVENVQPLVYDSPCYNLAFRDPTDRKITLANGVHGYACCEGW